MTRGDENRAELADRIRQAIGSDGAIEPWSGVDLYRVSAPVEAVHSVTCASFCLVAQGCKEVFLGASRYRYDPFHYLLATAQLPVVSRIVEASEDRPYLGLRLRLEPSVVGSLMIEGGVPISDEQTDLRAVHVSVLDDDLLDAVVRLVRLIERPAEAKVVVPLVIREIVFRLLIGEQGNPLRNYTLRGGNARLIAKALDKLRQEYDRPLRIDDLARDLGMSPSGFHHHFKAVTAMSPLQYQKQIRLQEARRLMVAEHLDAASAGHRVGYDDASYFNREYKRYFGQPPMRDIEKLRHSSLASSPQI